MKSKGWPYVKLFPADILGDARLNMASWDVYGIWHKMLWTMWDMPKRGVLAGTQAQICRVIGLTETELETFVSQAKQFGFCDVIQRKSGEIVIQNRRMIRDEKKRALDRQRKSKGSEPIDIPQSNPPDNSGDNSGAIPGDFQTSTHSPIIPSSHSLNSQNLKGVRTPEEEGNAQKTSENPANYNVEGDIPSQAAISDASFTDAAMLEAVRAQWDVVATRDGLPPSIKWSSYGKSNLRRSLQDTWWRETWQQGLDKIVKCPLLTGQNNSCFQADFDWFIKDDNLLKLMRGKFEKGKSEQEIAAAEIKENTRKRQEEKDARQAKIDESTRRINAQYGIGKSQ